MSSSVPAVVSSNKSRIPPHQRGQELTSRLPVAVIRHILTFLPFREFMITQKTCKPFKWDVITWTKTRGVFESGCLFKFFQRKKGLSDDAAFVEMRKIARCPVVDFRNLSSDRLVALLNEPNSPILSNVRTLRLCDLVLGNPVELANALLPQDSLKNLTSLHIPGEYLGTRSGVQFSLLPVCSSLTNLCFSGAPCYEADKLSKMCPDLRELSIQAHSTGVSKLLQFTQLTSLELDGTVDYLDNLNSLPRLSSLILRERYDGTAVRDGSLEHLAQTPCLRHLTLALREHDYGGVNELNLGILAPSAQLRVLEVHNLDKLRKPSLLATLPHQVTDLRLSDCELVDRDFAAIGRCIGLRRLAISTFQGQGEYTDLGIAQLRGCTALTALEFANRSFPMGGRGAAFTTEGLRRLLGELPALRQLALGNCLIEAFDTAPIERDFPKIDVIHPQYWLK